LIFIPIKIMKKTTLLFLFLLFFGDVNSQEVDSVKVLKFKINPLLMLSQTEIGGIFEWRLVKHISLETGGGINVPLSVLPGKGFTIRTGVRFYTQSGMYVNPAIFYRRTIYKYRNYYSSDRTDFSKEIGEPIQTRFSPNNGGATRYWGRDVSESKQVFALEILVGKEVRWFNKMLVDIYAGVGYRYKYKQQEIFWEMNGTVQTKYSPPKKENIHGFLPTIQAGIQIGIFSMPKIHSTNR
jgi:hypothetical protein